MAARRLYILLKREGWAVNHKRIHRLYKLLGLQLPVRRQKKRVSQGRILQDLPTMINKRLGMDFAVADSLESCRIDYNTKRPHSSIRDNTPSEYVHGGSKICPYKAKHSTCRLPSFRGVVNGVEYSNYGLHNNWG